MRDSDKGKSDEGLDKHGGICILIKENRYKRFRPRGWLKLDIEISQAN